MGEILTSGLNDSGASEYRSDFETFKSNVCHRVKDLGDIDFILFILQSDKIRNYFNKKWFPESLYLLAMIDYLSRENDIPICTKYNDIRANRLKSIIYPASIIVVAAASNDDSLLHESFNSSIPEFKQFNIVENEVRNVF